MSENTENPCHDLEIPNTDGPPGEPVPPVLPEAKFDPPLFPIVERNFPETGIPLSRRVTMMPRNLFYGDLQMVFSWGQGNFRSPVQASYSALTLNNPASSSRDYDPFRYVAGKVYGEKNRNNYVFSDSLAPDPQSGLDFKIIVDPTTPIIVRDGDITLSKNRVRCTFTIDALAERFGQFNEGQAHEWIKHTIPETPIPTIFTDTSFSAPASFFHREADGLNLRLPDLTTMQVFISDYISQSAQAGLHNSETNGSTTELSKKSLYEKFAMEYEERPEYCFIPGTGVTTHKYPANKIAMINDITEVATTVAERNDSEFSSFRRVFKRNYDFYTRISFDINHVSPIASKMKELNIDPLFLGMIDIESPSDESIYTQIMDETIQGFTGVSNNDGVSLNYRPNTYEEFLRKLNRYTNPNNPASLYDDLKLVLDPATFPMSYQAEENFLREQASIDEGGQFIPYYSSPQQVLIMMFTRWFFGHIADKKRTFKKIMGSELSYSEVVAYRLEKRDAQTNEVIQNFYFFNDPDTNRIDYVDTQVLFGKRYEYSIYTINMVQGSNYEYKRDLDANGYPVVSRDQGGGVAFQFDVHQTDNVSFIEAPYFQQELLIIDAPPMPPDVWFLPVETLTTDMVWFWFMPRMGQELAKPIAILEEDLEIIEKMKLSQNVGVHQNMEIRYKSDSDPTHYQLLVLDTPPLSYQDFILGRKDETTIASPSFKKSVVPNKDYYITFRSRDFAGISNPTKVYRYRLSSYGDGVGHEIEEYNFAEETQEHFLSFNQVVSVAPSANQKAVNFRQSSAYSDNLEDTRALLETTKGVDGLTLGVDEDNKIWDKKFLIEVVSTVTGKKIQAMTTWKQIVKSYEEVLPEFELLENQQNNQLSQGCYSTETRNRQRSNASQSNDEIETSLGVSPTRAQPSRGGYNSGSQ